MKNQEIPTTCSKAESYSLGQSNGQAVTVLDS